MRYGELLFVGVLLLYHAAVLFPRIRRPLAFNYLLWLAGLALVWSLSQEGWRWQTLPAIGVWTLDALWLLVSLRSLRGRIPARGFSSRFRSAVRAVLAWIAFVVAAAALLLSASFPLPKVPLTGGLAPSLRQLVLPSAAGMDKVLLSLWYPAETDNTRQAMPMSDPKVWQALEAQGAPGAFWQSYLSRLPSPLVEGGRRASPQAKYPVLFACLPRGTQPAEYSYLFADLASRGFVVVTAQGQLAPAKQVWFPSQGPDFSRWLEPERDRQTKSSTANFDFLSTANQAVRALDTRPGDPLEGAFDWQKLGLLVLGQVPKTPLPFPVQATLVWGSALNRPTPDPQMGLQLWAHGGSPQQGLGEFWDLTIRRWHQADLSDAAYLKPYLAFFHLLSGSGGTANAIDRQYQAAFFQHAFWGGRGESFRATVPELPGFLLSGS